MFPTRVWTALGLHPLLLPFSLHGSIHHNPDQLRQNVKALLANLFRQFSW
jgi:hypothetical protein